MVCVGFDYPFISIHALTKRATDVSKCQFLLSYISIHALTKRATDTAIQRRVADLISIHALTKRATYRVCGCSISSCHFNSRSHEESDSDGLYSVIHIINFNSRSHEESDDLRFSIIVYYFYFNSRSHEESDKIPPSRGELLTLFQFTLSRRERHLTKVSIKRVPYISIHALTKRATVYFSSFEP